MLPGTYFEIHPTDYGDSNNRTTENIIKLKRSDTSVLDIIFSNHMKEHKSTFSECSFLPESQDSETCLTTDPILCQTRKKRKRSHWKKSEMPRACVYISCLIECSSQSAK